MLKQQVQLILNESDFMKRSIILLPAFLAKGLEFDRVFLWDVDAEHFSSQQDKLILYTMCTRAMHELTLFTSNNESPLLNNMDISSYEKKVL